MQKVIIIGGTSGIGKELAKLFAGAGHFVGVTGRRQELLYLLQLEYPNYIVTECFDVTGNSNITHLESLIGKLGGLDLLIYNAGYGDISNTLSWELDKMTVDTNVNGFIEIVNYTFNYFAQQGYGHLATTSSIASIRGNGMSPAYSASKAFLQGPTEKKMEGLYHPKMVVDRQAAEMDAGLYLPPDRVSLKQDRVSLKLAFNLQRDKQISVKFVYRTRLI